MATTPTREQVGLSSLSSSSSSGEASDGAESWNGRLFTATNKSLGERTIIYITTKENMELFLRYLSLVFLYRLSRVSKTRSSRFSWGAALVPHTNL